MTTRLASESIMITLDGTSAELVPTLRAALRLARRYGTYSNLIGKLSEGSIEAVADVIAEGSGHRSALPAVLVEVETYGLIKIMALMIPALVEFVIALTGASPDDKADKTSNGVPPTWNSFHEELFSIATGWLGWSPAEAWAATPAEIIAARKGREAMLKAIYGSSEGTGEPTKPHDEMTLDEQAMAVFGGGRKRQKAR
ncbi:hypothetical protein U0C82_18730 [Fulvimarina sp. 2208YS6-2-32]|uniref:Tail assembly chaperone n=1 Tax=Fulvimarina uroteuthidis TaxID=3098149 RepID=A0ABU5IA75_9HYPH|nr:hypothetical protein [Fulvimarina sp. 2208YS6-2-32]MDY8111156.1 hypothetical protein [Fulvimarina sp. 2208YS6-2-32]